MPYQTIQRQIFDGGTSPRPQTDFITIGTVVCTSDPQQMGRVKAVCTQWGDTLDTPVENLPWISYISPFGGDFSAGARGPGVQETNGRVAYGFWSIPKIGAQIAVMCLDGDPSIRVYIGCLYTPLTTHTMPHGRYTFDDHPAVDKSGPIPFGPMSTSEQPIEPLASNMKEAFGNQKKNFEWQTRAADYQVSSVHPDHLDYTYSQAPDDYHVSDELTPSDWISTQGYNSTRYDPTEMESKITSMVTPGFHSISMDDRIENCRMRFRTSSGHQILLDDTNERIYISTAKGNNWIEMDQDGNIDIFSTNKLNVHTKRDINFTADETVRLYGKKGVHILSDDEIRIQSKKDINIKTAGNLRIDVSQSMFSSALGSIHETASGGIYSTALGSMHHKAGANLLLTASNDMHTYVSQTHYHTAANGADGAVQATSSTAASAQPAFWTNRVPSHEPWPRTMTKNDFTHEPEVSYFSKLVNRIERGRTIVRGLFWRR